MKNVYISSTFEDLKGHRRAVSEALHKAGYRAIAMETYVATDQRPLEKCLKDIEEVDIYIGLIAFRYGYIPEDRNLNPKRLSITELEYRHAKKLCKPCLIFIAKDDDKVVQKHVDAYTGDGEKGERIKAFRNDLLTERLFGEFAEPDKIAGNVLAAIQNHFNGECLESVKAQQSEDDHQKITWDINVDGSPYPGWEPFVDNTNPDKYSRVFFGRDTEVQAILKLIMGEPPHRFIIVSGDSGTGKSSVISAGVLPKIKSLGLPGARRVLCVRMIPSQKNSFAELMGALHPYATKVWSSPSDEADKLADNPDKLADHLRRILEKTPEFSGLVLFLDHMEGLFASANRAQSIQFLEAVYKAAYEQDFLWVLATIRSDYLNLCNNHPDMLKVIRNGGHYPLGAIQQGKLMDVIEKPAKCAGLDDIDEELVRLIIRDTRNEDTDARGYTKSGQSNLALLAFMLSELFKQRSGNTLTKEAYDRLGGVAGALENHVKQVEKELGANLHLLPEIFDRLIVLGAQPIPVLSYSQRGDFSDEQNEIVEKLVDNRLLRTEGKDEQIRFAFNNEVLFNVWPSLQKHVWKSGKKFIDCMILERQAKDWAERGKSPWKGLASKDQAKNYRSYRKNDPVGAVRDYLIASQNMRVVKSIAVLFTSGATLVGAVLVLAMIWLMSMGYSSFHQGGLKMQSFAGKDISQEPEMVEISGGSFQPGKLEKREENGDPQKNLAAAKAIKDFSLGKYEVTFEEYDRFALAEGKPLPSDEGWGRGKRPVINVSWRDAKAFIDWLNKQRNKNYRLPNELEWEYAAKGGDDMHKWAGTSEVAKLPDYAVFKKREAKEKETKEEAVKEEGPKEVGLGKNPNLFGLYDMSGNVWEWVEDCKVFPDEMALPEKKGGQTDPCQAHMIRGGSWDTESDNMHVWNSRWSLSDNRDKYLGFRLALDPKPEKKD